MTKLEIAVAALERIACGDMGGNVNVSRGPTAAEFARDALAAIHAAPVETLADDACVIGRYCRKHDFIHGAEAEEWRERVERFAAANEDNKHGRWARRLLDKVDARDSCAYVESDAYRSETLADDAGCQAVVAKALYTYVRDPLVHTLLSDLDAYRAGKQR